MDSSNSVLVSIIMPVFNSEEFLERAIESILFQTHSNFELIVIYDESTDGSLEIIEDYCFRDTRVKFLKGNKQGISGALNIGIEQSEGKFIARMDSDDICDRTRLEKQISLLEQENIDICGGHSLLMDASDRINGVSISPLGHQACTLGLGFDVPFFHPTVMMRSSFLIEHDLRYGQSRYKAAEDYDLWVRMHQAGALFGNVDDIVLKYRVLGDSLSRNNRLMLRDSKGLSNEFFRNNYIYCLQNIGSISEFGNSSEKSLAVRFIWHSFFKKGNVFLAKYLKFIGFKVFVYATLSEIIRTLRFRMW
jgi:glycosyltransferase involved in cell wall biosynthesis